MADWQSFQIQVPGRDLLEPVADVMQTLLIFLDVLQTILSTIKIFLVDFGNPLRALVEALIKLIQELFLSLKASGVFALFHVPNPVVDPNFDLNRGYDAFINVFKSSLNDAKDFNRPQPRPGSVKGGFVLLEVQSPNVYSLLSRIKQLLRFFSQEFTTPRYEAPHNFRVQPIGESGDPLLSVAAVFADSPLKAVSLSWTLPTTSETPDPGFSDLVSRVANEFVPASYLIEKSKEINPSVETVQLADLQNASKAGEVEYIRTVPTAGGDDIEKRELLRDDNDELVIKFTKYIVLDQLSVTSIMGQLGTFRYVDTDIETDTTYYYRVRAFSGDLDLTGDQINWGKPEYMDGHESPRLRWPSSSGDQDAIVITGKPTGIASIRIPGPIPDFDVVENLKRVFQSAFTCDFHRILPETENPEDADNIGKGSLSRQASAIADFEAGPLMEKLLRAQQGRGLADAIAILGEQEYPWENRSVRRQAAKLADFLASALMASGTQDLENFRSLMQSNKTYFDDSAILDLEQAVFELTDREASQEEKASIFLEAYVDPVFREDLLGVVGFLLPFTMSGTHPDWITINPLRDIVPWSGQLIYSLLDKVQALVDGFNGVVSEINNFIELLSQKIATLERTLQFLISILNFIETLEFSAYLLAVPEIDGYARDWIRAVDTAGGTIPLRGPGGYSSGVALAYVGADVTAFKTAFSIIFGV